MFSATLPRSLADFAAAGLSSPQLVRLDADRKLSPDLGLAFFTGEWGRQGGFSMLGMSRVRRPKMPRV
jgi:hypothetical protein